MNNDANSKYQGDQFETIAIREQTARSSLREHSTALHMSSSFVFDDAEQARALFADEQVGNIYTRFSNPNNSSTFEKILFVIAVSSGPCIFGLTIYTEPFLEFLFFFKS